jgi:serine/threonine-protein kinase
MSLDLQPQTDIPLQGRALFLARAAWGVIAALSLSIWIPTLIATYFIVIPLPFVFDQSISTSLPIWWTLGFLWFAIPAIFIFWRKSNDKMVIFTSITLLTIGPTVSLSLVFDFLLADQLIVLLLAKCLLYLGCMTTTIFFYIFPDGRFIPNWTRGLTGFLAIVSLISIFVLPTEPIDPNTYGPVSLGKLNTLLMIALWTGVIAQAYRYTRFSTALQRQQAKWVIFGLLISLLALILIILLGWILSLVTLGLVSSPNTVAALQEMSDTFAKCNLSHVDCQGPLFSLISRNIFVLPYLLTSYLLSFFLVTPNLILTLWPVILPITITISILRYRLWDIDFLINRTLVYGILTLLLALAFGCILYVVSLITPGASSVFTVSIAAVGVGSLFQPTRRTLQRFVDRRFYNIQIDYQKPLTSISVSQIIKQTDFGAYKNLELIGRGGMAEVYKSIHPTLNVPVAIKLLPSHLATEIDFRQRFTREAQVVTKLEHPNIVRAFDYGELDSTHYIVMEYLTGKDLDKFIKTNGKLSLAQALPIIRQIAAALDYAHAQNLIHRDIKPSNIMLDEVSSFKIINNPKSEVRAVLTDFGIAKIMGGHTALTQAGGMLGTLAYMAPEQIEASANIDSRADIYAFGVMVYQMLTGELPFKHNHPNALLIAHIMQPPPNPKEIMPDLPDYVGYAIQRAMAKKPGDRFATVMEFAKELSRTEN